MKPLTDPQTLHGDERIRYVERTIERRLDDLSRDKVRNGNWLPADFPKVERLVEEPEVQEEPERAKKPSKEKRKKDKALADAAAQQAPATEPAKKSGVPDFPRRKITEDITGRKVRLECGHKVDVHPRDIQIDTDGDRTAPCLQCPTPEEE